MCIAFYITLTVRLEAKRTTSEAHFPMYTRHVVLGLHLTIGERLYNLKHVPPRWFVGATEITQYITPFENISTAHSLSFCVGIAVAREVTARRCVYMPFYN